MRKLRPLSPFALFVILVLAAVTGFAAEPPLRGGDYEKPLEYQDKRLGPGAEYHYYLLKSAFGAPQSISIVILDWNKDWRPHLHFCGEKRRPTSAQAREVKADVAVNGTYFAFSKPPRAVLQLRIDGKTLFPAGKRTGAGFFYFNPGEFPKISAECPPEEQYQNILQSYPLLIADGKPTDVYPRQGRNPRTILGVTADRKLVIVVVDGRAKEAAGLTFRQAADLMVSLGCTDALNLDGGGSTTLYLKGRGVVNHPCDNKKFDNAGERAVNDIVYFVRD